MNVKSQTKPVTKQKFPLPKPMELARLAAILKPQAILAPPGEQGEALRRAMTRAMEFYVEAVYFVDELPSDWEAILEQFGSDERNSPRFGAALIEELRWNKLKLEPRKDGDDADEVRQFLKANGLKFKLARSFLDSFRKTWEANREANPQNHHKPADEFIALLESTENGEKIYRFPQRTLESFVTLTKQRRSESKRKGQRTRKLNLSNKS